MTIPDARLRQLRDLLGRSAIEGSSGVIFHMRELLGEGGQGWVYRAGYDDPEGPPVVVKLLRPDVVSDDSLSRFLREAEVLKKLSADAPCPSLVRFFEHGIHRAEMPDRATYALPFTVLEHVKGTNLQQILSEKPGKGLHSSRVRRMGRQLVRALSMVHKAQIIHRDIKPSNILVTQELDVEVVKLTDFGLVKRYDVDLRGTLTMAGASLGYAPPEQFEAGNKRVSERTDVFSLAAVMYECLTAYSAFNIAPTDNSFQVLSRVLSGERPALSRNQKALSSELADRHDLVASLDRELSRALSPEPEKRHASVDEFWNAVEPLLRSTDRPFGSTARMGASVKTSAPVLSAKSSASGSPPVTRAPDVRVASSSLLPETARSIAFSHDGLLAFALGRTALFRFQNAVWSRVVLPMGVDTASLSGLVVTPASEVVLFGQRGTILGLAADGSLRPWAQADPDVSWVGATVEPNEILFLGTSASRRLPVIGVLRQGGTLSINPVEGTARLLAATRLASGNLIACGEAGELAVLGAGPARGVPWGRTGHLFAMCRGEDGVHAVGSGGHALLVTPAMEARLEPVQTTRDLFTVAAAQGTVLAGGSDGRLVRRTPTAWTRVALPKEAGTTIRAISVQATRYLCACDDGLVVTGRIE